MSEAQERERPRATPRALAWRRAQCSRRPANLCRVGAQRADLDRFWGRALAAYKAAVEQDTEEVP